MSYNRLNTTVLINEAFCLESGACTQLCSLSTWIVHNYATKMVRQMRHLVCVCACAHVGVFTHGIFL